MQIAWRAADSQPARDHVHVRCGGTWVSVDEEQQRRARVPGPILHMAARLPCPACFRCKCDVRLVRQDMDAHLEEAVQADQLVPELQRRLAARAARIAAAEAAGGGAAAEAQETAAVKTPDAQA